MTDLLLNPYDGVDWDAIEYHRCEFHNHQNWEIEGWDPHDVIDTYYDDGPYTVGGASLRPPQDSPNENPPVIWPWTDLEDTFDETSEQDAEDRDPKTLDMVAFPASEILSDEHINTLFSDDYDDNDSIRQDDKPRSDVLEWILEADGARAVLAHPSTYYDDPDLDWDRYIDDFEAFDDLIGLEVWSREGRGVGTDDVVWDHLQAHFSPDRQVIGFGVDDAAKAGNVEPGEQLFRQWTTVLLHPDEFDPEDQESSMDNVRDAFDTGRLFVERVDEYDGLENQPDTPTVNEVIVDNSEKTVTLDASGYEEIRWLMRGAVVSTGESLDYSRPSVHTAVRAELIGNPGGYTSTQNFLLSGPDSDLIYRGDSRLDVEAKSELEVKSTS